MTDPNQPTPPSFQQPVPPAQPTGQAPAPLNAQQDMEQGKLFAALSYGLNFLSLPFWIIPLVMRDSAYALFHAKQCLVIFIFGVAAFLISFPLVFVCGIGFVTMLAASVFIIVFCILGLIQVSKGEAKPLPLIGGFAESWFKGITYQPKTAGPR